MNPVTTKHELEARLSRHRDEIRQLGVQRLGLFGSFRHDKANEDSDIDFIVHFRRGEKTYLNLFELSELLEQILGRRIELITPDSLSEPLRQQILQDVEYVQEPDDLHRPHSR